MSVTTIEAVVARAREQATAGVDVEDAVDGILAAAGGDRKAVESARDAVAEKVHARSDDFDSTAALQLLNRVLSRIPIDDPLDWRVRWTQRFKKP